MGMVQTQLDGMLGGKQKEFSHEAILKATTELVACSNLGRYHSPML